MAQFSQKNSPLQVFTPLAEDALLPVRLTGWETLNESFEFTLDLLAPRHSEIPFEKLLGQDAGAQVSLADGTVRHFNGMVWSFSQSDSDEVFDHYRMVLKPRLANLALVKRSRIFQNQTALEILKRVLEPVGGAEYEVHEKPGVRLYCTQYDETDLDFFLRLCSEEGISHHWRHGRRHDGTAGELVQLVEDHQQHHNPTHTLVLASNTSLSQSTGEIEYRTVLGGSEQKTAIRSWRVEQKLTSTRAQVLDSHFQFYGQILQATATGLESTQAGHRKFHTPAAPGPWVPGERSFARQFDAIDSTGTSDPAALGQITDAQEHRARVAATGMMADSVRALATGDCNQVTAGYSFQLQGHHRQDGDWLAVRVEHTVEVEGSYWAGEATSMKREARVEAAPLSLQQPPWPPRPRPTVKGVETAMVTGPRGMDTFVDPYGRVKVYFWFDPTARKNSTSSCWVRVAQGWAGKGYGAAFWPRVGHEVVVSFERGDPDRPIITGSVYNGTNNPPFELPENVYLSGYKTLCQGGDVADNYHLLLLSDERGAEVVHIHAEARFNTTQESSQVSMRPQTDINIQG
jgi:type VI secretion system secreted protein VgrG